MVKAPLKQGCASMQQMGMHAASTASSQSLNANYLIAVVLRLEKPGGV